MLPAMAPTMISVSATEIVTQTERTDAISARPIQSAEASQVGLKLRGTTLVIFGSPVAGTPVMAASPLAALDMPLKVLIWDNGGQTSVSYDATATLAARHHLSADLAAKLAGIDPLTDTLITT